MKKRLLSILLALCMALTLLPGTVLAAASGTCGENLTWTLDNAGTLTISGTGAMEDYSFSSISSYYKPTPWSDYNKEIKHIIVEDGVTRIGDEAFGSMLSFRGIYENVESILIGDSVEEIGMNAFLSTYTSEIVLPKALKTIGEAAFYDSAFRSIVIPDGVTSIGRLAFSNCTKLSSVTIPNSVTSIGPGAFNFCESLTNFIIPDSMTNIEYETFMACKNLTSITIPASVTNIENEAFYKCNSLSDVYYSGTEAQWQNITVGTMNDALNTATIHCTGTAPAPTLTPIPTPTPSTTPSTPTPTPSVTPSTPVTVSPAFTDVAANSAFAPAISWAVENGITTGKTDGTFAPNENCTNGQILTFLWRANGSPEPTIDNPFTDSIPASFQKAAVWAYEKGLVSGGVFGSDTPCTRSMVVTYLWQLAGSPAVSGSTSFPDVASGAEYAQAVTWAVENGITTGKTNGTFGPGDVCTRGQIVTFLYRDFA